METANGGMVKLRSLVGSIMFVIALLLTQGPSMASEVTPQWSDNPRISYKVVSKSVVSTSYTNKSKVIGQCKISRANSTCTISSGSTATGTVQAALGAAPMGLSGQVGVSGSKSVSVNVSCTSPKMPKNSSYRAWAVGTRYKYKVQKIRTVWGSSSVQGTSGWLYAFKPSASKIDCG